MQTPHQPPPHQARTDRPQPTRHCDVIMKGGITSGVVYPLALVELSRAFRLKNIGGTSAGAIAASAAAAAELGRGKPGAGFDELAGLPAFLAGNAPGSTHSRLFGFFHPQPETRRLFRLGLAALNGPGISRLLPALMGIYWEWALIGALPGLILSYFVGYEAGLGAQIAGRISGLVATLAGAVLLPAWIAKQSAFKQLPDNFYGLCSGLGEPGSLSALTDWLTAYLDRLAGRPADGPPLTFGDLWQRAPGSDERVINLEMMTTCLSHGRPYRLPFRQDDEVNENTRFYFNETEFRRLFPARVVDHMVARARQPTSQRGRTLPPGHHPLPRPEDMPVVVATRMSLSFPVLLGAIPLHAFDHESAGDTARLEHCWFSDGGICSNFPIHFFDEPLPSHPTFAIDLVARPPGCTQPVKMPKRNEDGQQERWQRFSGRSTLWGFLGAIKDTSMSWMDNTQAKLPGYRDRVATIGLSDDEGGLNLNMPPPLIQTLSDMGKTAGCMLVERFAGAPPAGIELTWENHRRVRLRSLLAAIEELIVSIEDVSAHPHADDPPYETVVTAQGPGYPWASDAQRDHAAETLRQLRLLGQKIATQTAPRRLKAGAPKPRPQLRLRGRA